MSSCDLWQFNAGILGGVFRVQDGLNYYYVLLDRAAGVSRIGQVIGGTGLAAASALRTYTWPGGASYKLNQPIAVSVQMNYTGIYAWVRAAIAVVFVWSCLMKAVVAPAR
jgi:hypothetical protein